MSHVAGSGYRVEIDCRWCGGDLRHLADGRAVGTESRAVARCCACGTEWTVTVMMVDPTVGRRKLTPAKQASMALARAARTY